MSKRIPANFHAFKPNGKWYTSATGYLPGWFEVDPWNITVQSVLLANNGHWPGLSSDGAAFIRIVFPEWGVPFLIREGEADCGSAVLDMVNSDSDNTMSGD